jgi:hypothetical protein
LHSPDDEQRGSANDSCRPNFVLRHRAKLLADAEALWKDDQQRAIDYAQRTGQPIEVCNEWINGGRDFWFNAKDALKAGSPTKSQILPRVAAPEFAPQAGTSLSLDACRPLVG